jgi:hypothetical protein
MAAPTGTSAALGFSVHTGWAAAVVVAGPLEEPVVLERTRVTLGPDGSPGHSRFVYHQALALEQPLAEAERSVKATAAVARTQAKAAIAALIASARQGDHRVVGSGIGLHERPLPALADILRSHPLLHAAEGALYGHALVSGSESHRLPTLTVPPKEIAARCAEVLGMGGAALDKWLTALGRRAGRPWAQDQRIAAMLAVIVLAGRR